MSCRLFTEITGIASLDELTHATINAMIEANPRGWKPPTLRRASAGRGGGLVLCLPGRCHQQRPATAACKGHTHRQADSQERSLEDLRAMLEAARQFTDYLSNGVPRWALL